MGRSFWTRQRLLQLAEHGLTYSLAICSVVLVVGSGCLLFNKTRPQPNQAHLRFLIAHENPQGRQLHSLNTANDTEALFLKRMENIVNNAGPPEISITYSAHNDTTVLKRRTATQVLQNFRLAGNPSEFTLAPPEASAAYEKRGLFTWEKIPDEPLDTVFNETLAKIISMYPNYTECRQDYFYVQEDDRTLKLISFWSQLARTLKIPYMFIYGSILGYARNKEPIPFDHDLDVGVPASAFWKLIAYMSMYPVDWPSEVGNFTIQLNLGFLYSSVGKRRFYSCKGEPVDTRVDGCAYSCLMGRIFYQYRQLDLFPLDHLVEDDAFFIRSDYGSIGKADIMFPPRPCTILNIPTLCPNNYQSFLLGTYGYEPDFNYTDLRPNRVCHDAEVFTRKDAIEGPKEVQQKFKEMDDQWEVFWKANKWPSRSARSLAPVLYEQPYSMICKNIPKINLTVFRGC